MAKTTGKEQQGAPIPGRSSAKATFDTEASTKSLAEQAVSTGPNSDKAKSTPESSTDAIKGQASDLVDAAKDVASQATDKIKDAVNSQKSSGAEYVGNLAETMRRAAREFDTDLPLAGSYIRKAASQIEGVSDHIRNGNLNDVVRNAQSFARRQPTAFLGLAVLAGFGAVRFLKSSSTDDGPSSQALRSDSRSSAADNRGYRDDFSN
ncbi:YtxH domain-containing protein [Bradyrhizobium sp. JYMT SZCCT0428]|uniref:YtxH domain-containing protein n=1 Tax=Bradyrhizobium sp. JYMT SZCCT0428 TaxID=2807673 RepID=UPI001BAD27E1|nr:YtxH domain-containing protein [Bradyrhizobium sp. JYMT SZCCT0428]MBR1153140.1 YtxH domain-containing protein [Bradyrhizobium sp. JYMT SZCCT0428]